MAATTFVQLDPEELVFRDVRLSQVCRQTHKEQLERYVSLRNEPVSTLEPLCTLRRYTRRPFV